MVVPWHLPNSIKHFVLVKRRQSGLVGSVLPLHLSVCAHQPLEKSLIRTDPLLIRPADAAATAKTSAPPWQHDHSSFRQERAGTLQLSTLQSRIKWNMMTSQQAGVWDFLTKTAPFMSWTYLDELEKCPISISSHLQAPCELTARLTELYTQLKTAPSVDILTNDQCSYEAP